MKLSFLLFTLTVFGRSPCNDDQRKQDKNLNLVYSVRITRSNDSQANATNGDKMKAKKKRKDNRNELFDGWFSIETKMRWDWSDDRRQKKTREKNDAMQVLRACHYCTYIESIQSKEQIDCTYSNDDIVTLSTNQKKTKRISFIAIVIANMMDDCRRVQWSFMSFSSKNKSNSNASNAENVQQDKDVARNEINFDTIGIDCRCTVAQEDKKLFIEL